jgi:hypothetical protein
MSRSRRTARVVSHCIERKGSRGRPECRVGSNAGRSHQNFSGVCDERNVGSLAHTHGQGVRGIGRGRKTQILGDDSGAEGVAKRRDI